MQVYRIALAACLGLVPLTFSVPARAQYVVTNLDANQLHQVPAAHIDPLLANPWGLARSATSPWWVSDNDTGWSTIYKADGTLEPLRVLIPTSGNGPASPTGLNGPGTPSGIVYNGSSTDFQIQGWPTVFLFATLDGTISGWAPGLNANQSLIAVDNKAKPAMCYYTGLAITSHPTGNFLYAADNFNNVVDMYDGNFTLVKSFGDPSIPSNFSVFGIQDIDGLVYVTYAIPGVGEGGYVDIFTEDGVDALPPGQHLIQGLPLNQAWGVAAAPSNFGPLSNTLLISNNSVNGTINAFDPITGKFVGTVKDRNGKVVVLNNLWGIAFGGGNSANGAANELFVTVGNGIGTAEIAGTFLSIKP